MASQSCWDMVNQKWNKSTHSNRKQQQNKIKKKKTEYYENVEEGENEGMTYKFDIDLNFYKHPFAIKWAGKHNPE